MKFILRFSSAIEWIAACMIEMELIKVTFWANCNCKRDRAVGAEAFFDIVVLWTGQFEIAIATKMIFNLTIVLVAFKCFVGSSAFSFAIGLNATDHRVLIRASEILLESFYRNRTTTVFMIVSAETDRSLFDNFILARDIMSTQHWSLSFAVEGSNLENKEFRRFFSFLIVENYQSFRWAKLCCFCWTKTIQIFRFFAPAIDE